MPPTPTPTPTPNPNPNPNLNPYQMFNNIFYPLPRNNVQNLILSFHNSKTKMVQWPITLHLHHTFFQDYLKNTCLTLSLKNIEMRLPRSTLIGKGNWYPLNWDVEIIITVSLKINSLSHLGRHVQTSSKV